MLGGNRSACCNARFLSPEHGIVNIWCLVVRRVNQIPSLQFEQVSIVLAEQDLLHDMESFDYLKQIDDV